MAQGMVIICDRCGEQVIIKERDEGKYRHHNAFWRWQHLCLECSQKYNEMEDLIRAFRGKQESKFYNER